MKYIDENDKICGKSSMFLYGKSRLTGKDSFKEITDIISQFSLALKDYQKDRVRMVQGMACLHCIKRE